MAKVAFMKSMRWARGVVIQVGAKQIGEEVAIGVEKHPGTSYCLWRSNQ